MPLDSVFVFSPFSQYKNTRVRGTLCYNLRHVRPVCSMYFGKKVCTFRQTLQCSITRISAFLLASFKLSHTQSQTHCRRNFSTFFILFQGPTQLADGHDQPLVYMTRIAFFKWTRVDLESKSWSHFHWQAMHVLGCKSQVLKA